MLGSASRDFHRWHTNEMLIASYKMAEKRKDSKTLERAATTYGKLNRVDLEDEQAITLDQILVQPFTATDDPRVLGIEPITNIAEKNSAMIGKYRAETIDIGAARALKPGSVSTELKLRSEKEKSISMQNFQQRCGRYELSEKTHLFYLKFWMIKNKFDQCFMPTDWYCFCTIFA